jgi:hypothetical protein
MQRCLICSALALLLASGCGRRVADNVSQTFEKSDEGWTPYGWDAQVEVTRDPSLVKSGTSALAIHYKYTPGQYGSAVLPLESGQFARTPNLRFWIHTDMATPVIVILSEKQPGGYYSSWFWCPKDEWQLVKLAPSDFILNTGPSDPKDPDGRLDLDRVNAIGISDLGQAFQTIGVQPAYPVVIEKGSGVHTIAIDDFNMSSQSDAGSDRLIGGAGRGFLTWITMGGAQLEIAGSQNPLGIPVLRATYARTAGRYVVIAHTLANVDLSGASKLVFRIASTNDAKFLVYLEERLPGSALGPRYSAMFAVPGGSRGTDQALALSNFTFDSTGPSDADGRLDAGQLKSISLIDITTAEGNGAGSNTMWISALRPQ